MQTRYQIRTLVKHIVLIRWAFDLPNYEAGDCVVVVDPEGAEAVGFCSGSFEPMTLEEIRAFVAADTSVLGSLIHDCHGVILDNEMILFEHPIVVRNHKAKETA